VLFGSPTTTVLNTNTAPKDLSIVNNFFPMLGCMGRDSSVGTVTGCMARSGLHIVTFPASYPVATGRSFPETKPPVREPDHSPPSDAEVENGGAIRPLPGAFHGMTIDGQMGNIVGPLVPCSSLHVNVIAQNGDGMLQHSVDCSRCPIQRWQMIASSQAGVYQTLQSRRMRWAGHVARISPQNHDINKPAYDWITCVRDMPNSTNRRQVALVSSATKKLAPCGK
jgi:hypothetical protein